MADEQNGIKILGQTFAYPTTAAGTISVIAICIAVVVSIYFVLHAPAEKLRAVGVAFFHADAGASPTQERGERSYGFWTPSETTAKELQADTNKEDEWLKSATKAKIEDFAARLRKLEGVEGFRRSEVWGVGRDQDKPPISGFWWSVRAKKRLSVEKISNFYHEQWKNSRSLYIEVLYSTGTFK
jgi:hypothetical protein